MFIISHQLIYQADELYLKVYYWRENNKEVYFIVEPQERLVAIEVRSGQNTQNKRLAELRKKFNPIGAFFVGTNGIPIEKSYIDRFFD